MGWLKSRVLNCVKWRSGVTATKPPVCVVNASFELLLLQCHFLEEL
jgi:hypothetical protein